MARHLLSDLVSFGYKALRYCWFISLSFTVEGKPIAFPSRWCSEVCKINHRDCVQFSKIVLEIELIMLHHDK